MTERDEAGCERAERHRCLLLRCDSPEPEVVSRYGEFDEWFGKALGGVADLSVVDVRTTPLSTDLLRGCSSVMISGSRHSAYAAEPWIAGLEEFVRAIVRDRRLPLLGVCFGHQVLARACGGHVEPNPRGLELGTIEVRLNAHGEGDPLFHELGSRFWAQALHTDTVCRPPEGAEILASSDRDGCQAFSFHRAYGVQFHPEVTGEMLEGYIRGGAERLRAQGEDPDALLANLRSSSSGSMVLRNFIRTASEHASE
jgi:GMP synthase (glutamine-hydrolysing)